MGSLGEAPIRRHQLSVTDYYRMAEVGVLAPDARVELIEGEIIDMPPIGSPHSGVVNDLMRRFFRGLGERVVVSVQNPLRLGEWSEPQPDVVVLKAREDMYKDSHPTAEDVLLVVEVSQSSLRYDREIKLPLYAKHHVREVWILDVEHHQLGVYRSPENDRYVDQQVIEPLRTIYLASMPGVEIDLTGLL